MQSPDLIVLKNLIEKNNWTYRNRYDDVVIKSYFPAEKEAGEFQYGVTIDVPSVEHPDLTYKVEVYFGGASTDPNAKDWKLSFVILYSGVRMRDGSLLQEELSSYLDQIADIDHHCGMAQYVILPKDYASKKLDIAKLPQYVQQAVGAADKLQWIADVLKDAVQMMLD